MKFVSILEDGDKFDKLVKDAPALVKFFHPTCGHCKDMAPHWDSLKDKLKEHHHKNINVIEVHADTIPEIKSECAKNILGYPTIMEVKKEGKAGREHKGERHTDALHKFFLETFVNEMKGGGIKRKAKKSRNAKKSRKTKKSRKAKKTLKNKKRRKTKSMRKRTY